MISATAAAQDGVEIRLAGGKAAVSDWVVEQTLDLAAAARLMGDTAPVESARVCVIEVGAGGAAISVVPCQVDPAESADPHVITWQAPGQTRPGQTRRFLITLDGRDGALQHAAPLVTTADEHHVRLVNGPIALEHARDAGGMIHHVTVDGAPGDLSWQDYLNMISPDRPHHSYPHAAEQLRVVASGSLRAVVEARTELLENGKSHPSGPRVTYRFTT
ncbi:MAG: hypothetical protein CMJ84_15985 [Planctomycetes bacterium]|nr:hypothetical protein [Planctomycetota bacterium]